MRIGIIIQKIPIICAYLFCHFLDRTSHSGICRELNQVANIACPAAEVGSLLISRMVCHIQAAKHMRKIYLIAVREIEITQLTQTARVSSVGDVLLLHVRGKRRVFRPAKSCPCTGSILFNAAANIVDDESGSVGLGMLCRIAGCIALKLRQS